MRKFTARKTFVLGSARITGVPYATDPRIQKVELDAKNASLGGK